MHICEKMVSYYWKRQSSTLRLVAYYDMRPAMALASVGHHLAYIHVVLHRPDWFSYYLTIRSLWRLPLIILLQLSYYFTIRLLQLLLRNLKTRNLDFLRFSLLPVWKSHFSAYFRCHVTSDRKIRLKNRKCCIKKKKNRTIEYKM